LSLFWCVTAVTVEPYSTGSTGSWSAARFDQPFRSDMICVVCAAIIGARGLGDVHSIMTRAFWRLSVFEVGPLGLGLGF
jgi:hypothetical protein